MLSAVSFGGRFAAAGRNADEFPADNPGATDFGNAVFGQFHVFADRHAHHGTNSITSNRPFALVLFNKLPDVPQGVLSLRDHSVKRCLRGFAHLDEIRGFTNNHSQPPPKRHYNALAPEEDSARGRRCLRSIVG